MRYEDGPAAEVEVLIDAPVERVWDLVTDINLPAGFLDEFRGATWFDDGPRWACGCLAATGTRPWVSGRRYRS